MNVKEDKLWTHIRVFQANAPWRETVQCITKTLSLQHFGERKLDYYQVIVSTLERIFPPAIPPILWANIEHDCFSNPKMCGTISKNKKQNKKIITPPTC